MLVAAFFCEMCISPVAVEALHFWTYVHQVLYMLPMINLTSRIIFPIISHNLSFFGIV